MIEDNVFTANVATILGSGILGEAGAPVIRGCEFTGNQAGSGAIYFLEATNPRVIDCDFRGNIAVGMGGGIASELSEDIEIRDCRFWENDAADGGAICITTSSAAIVDCRMWANDADFGGGLELISATAVTLERVVIEGNEARMSGGGIQAAYSSVTLDGCRVAGNLSWGPAGGAKLFESAADWVHCTLSDNSATSAPGGIQLDSYSRLSFIEGELAGNGVAIVITGTPQGPVDARFNWWGDASGPYHPLLNPNGQGDQVGDEVVFEPWNAASAIPGPPDGAQPEPPAPDGAQPDPRAPCGTHAFALRCAPNPATGATAIRFRLEEPGDYRVEAYDAAGRRLALIAAGTATAGEHALLWRLPQDLVGRSTDPGRQLHSQVCFVTLRAGSRRETTRLLLLR